VKVLSTLRSEQPAQPGSDLLTLYADQLVGELRRFDRVILQDTLGVAGEGVFAVTDTVFGGEGVDCNFPTGGRDICPVVSGQFTTNMPTHLRAHNFIGAPSSCFPPKRCPETHFCSDVVAVLPGFN